MINENNGILKIHRLPNFVGKLRSYSILVDGIKVNSIKDGETVNTPLVQGHHNVMVRLDWYKSNKVDINVISGQTIRLHIGREQSKGWKLVTIKGMYLLMILFGAVFMPALLGAGTVGLVLHRTGKLRLF